MVEYVDLISLWQVLRLCPVQAHVVAWVGGSESNFGDHPVEQLRSILLFGFVVTGLAALRWSGCCLDTARSGLLPLADGCHLFLWAGFLVMVVDSA